MSTIYLRQGNISVPKQVYTDIQIIILFQKPKYFSGDSGVLILKML